MSHWTENPEIYRRNLPHFAPPKAALFVTFRLHDSLPKATLDQFQAEQMRIATLKQSGKLTKEEAINLQKRHFAGFDRILDMAEGSHALKNPLTAKIVSDILHEMERQGHIRLWCFTIMANHVHILFSLIENGKSLREVMQLMKGRSAFECNKLLEQRGTFWQHESYDHVVREGEFERIILYILMNPVKAGLVKDWRDYPWSYVHPTFANVAL